MVIVLLITVTSQSGFVKQQTSVPDCTHSTVVFFSFWKNGMKIDSQGLVPVGVTIQGKNFSSLAVTSNCFSDHSTIPFGTSFFPTEDIDHNSLMEGQLLTALITLPKAAGYCVKNNGLPRQSNGPKSNPT